MLKKNSGIKSLLETLVLRGKNQEHGDPEWSATKPPRVQGPKRSSDVVIASFAVLILSAWSVYYVQFQSLPAPVPGDGVGFSEVEAVKHIQALDEFGPHSVGSDALDRAVQYVKTVAESIKNTSHGEVDVEVEQFHVKSGVNRLDSGRFSGKTGIYADLDHVLIKVSPRDQAKNGLKAEKNAILVSSHIDTVFSGYGAGDDSSNVAVMLELARGVALENHNFKSPIIFFFNTGEEEGLYGSHSFITQHPWRETIRFVVNLEAMGIGGKSGIFQTGPESLAIEDFAKAAKYPSGQIVTQDLFSSGAVNSGTDFQVYKEVGGLSGLDFAFTDRTAVYHTKNDKFELLKPGSLQHLGDNMLPFLLQSGSSPDLPIYGEENSEDESSVYFDILGMYMIVYRKTLGKMVNNCAILLSLLLWSFSLYVGGDSATISFVLSLLSVILMWILSLSSSLLVAFILSYISSSAPVPYIKFPWLVVGLFGSPSLLGALAGQRIGFRILQIYLSTVYSEANVANLEAERWLYKSGIVEWLLLLIGANYFEIGSSYIALVWLATPALAYVLMEATLSPTQLSKPLKSATLLVGLSVPILVSAGPIIRNIEVGIGTTIRLDSNPGSVSDWSVNVIVAAVVAAIVCLMLVHLLSYVHLSGAGRSITGAAFILFGLSLAAILAGVVPTYTEDFARTLHVVHVVDTTGNHSNNSQNPISYISLSSLAPGPLTKEMEHIDQGFVCGNNMTIDFVTFSVNYGCWTSDDDGENGWSSEQDLPTLQVQGDLITTDKRVTQVSLDTKSSTRWSLAINTQQIEDFELNVGQEEWVSLGSKNSKDGWHIIQFAGGKESPTNFTLKLHWAQNSSFARESDRRPLLKLRTDVAKLTPKVEMVLKKLPSWCALFGKSTAPYNLAFLANLPVDF